MRRQPIRRRKSVWIFTLILIWPGGVWWNTRVFRNTRDVGRCDVLRIILCYRGPSEIWPKRQIFILDLEFEAKTSEDVAKSSDAKKSPRTFGVIRQSSPRAHSNTRTHTHTHTHTQTLWNHSLYRYLHMCECWNHCIHCEYCLVSVAVMYVSRSRWHVGHS